MDEKNLNKSVIVYGPTGVGKSFTTDKLSKLGVDGYEVISTDLLYSFAILSYQGALNDFDKFEKEIRQITLNSRVNPMLPEYEFRLSKHKKDADNYFATIKRYMNLIDLPSLAVYVNALSYLNSFKGTDYFSEAGYEYLRSLLFARMVEQAISGVNKPIILDAGSNFGSSVTASKSEKEFFSKFMKVDYNLDNYMDKFMKMFKTRVYFNPGKSYEKNPYSHERLSKMHYGDGKRYKYYATDEIDVSKFHSGYDEEIFGLKRRILDTDIDLIRLQFIDGKEAMKVYDELYAIITQKAKKYE